MAQSDMNSPKPPVHSAVPETVDEPIEDKSEQEDEEIGQNIHYKVSSYGADYPVDGIVKRLESKSIVVPDFQRQYVWTIAQASRFIESLLLGLPVPGIFLYKDPDSEILNIIDGQQRLMTLKYFYAGTIRDRAFKLKGVVGEFDGKSYRSLEEEDKRRLDDSIIHATVVRQDDPEDDRSSIYLVFERLNTGGTPLSSQEIRTSVYSGKFCDLLRRLNDDKHWRILFGQQNKRGKDEELILRFFALLYNLDNYKRPMKLFLNNFMNANRNLIRYSESDLTDIFNRTVALSIGAVGASAFRPERALNAALTDAVLVGTARRLQRGDTNSIEEYKEKFHSLVGSEEFLSKCKVGTTSDENLRSRIDMAVQAFEGIR